MAKHSLSGDEADQRSANDRAFDVWRARVAGVTVISVRGDIDMLNAPRLVEAILDTLPEQPTAVIVDLSDVDFLASAGMTALITTQKQVTAIARFLVVADGPGTSRPMKMMGLDSTLALHSTLDEALAACSTK